jgi:hypothetical protein
MKSTSSKLVKITQKASTGVLSKGQKLFNKLIKKIETQRQQLRAWQTAVPLYQQKYQSLYMPLLTAYDEQRAQLVYLFDRCCEDKLFTKTDRKKLAGLILTIAGEILRMRDDPAVKAVFNKYNAVDFDTEIEAAKMEAKAMMEQMFGSEIKGDFDMKDPESILRMMAEQARQIHEQEEQQRQQAAAQPENSGQRKKTAKQLAKEAKLAEEEKNVSQSIREVYRKLASALHPDREQDMAERARKTNLMQRVNVAYDNKDLLRLLELQLEVEQIDQTMINTISESRLKHYNQILAEQSDELEAEVLQTELAFRLRFQIDEHQALAPERLILDLESDIIQLEESIDSIKDDLKEFAEPKKLKAWLKTYRIAPMPTIESLYGDPEFEAIFNRM